MPFSILVGMVRRGPKPSAAVKAQVKSATQRNGISIILTRKSHRREGIGIESKGRRISQKIVKLSIEGASIPAVAGIEPVCHDANEGHIASITHLIPRLPR